MTIDQKALERISELLRESEVLSIGDENGCAVDDLQCNECEAWITAAVHVVGVICEKGDTYNIQVNRIANRDSGYLINKNVGALAATLRHLLKDAQNGLLSSVANKAIALTFDDFLDHAHEYSKRNMKNEAGVIVGVVFEDAVRKVCAIHNIDTQERTLEPLINALSAQQVITGAKSKRAKAAAHIRSKASHALWDAFDISDVESSIQFSREFIEEFLQ
jgi:hypothetical protein